MKLSLYQIESEYLQIAETLQDNGGELTPELELALVINKDQLEVKSAGYGYVIKETLAEIDTINAEIERLEKMKSVRENAINRLKSAVKTAMELYGVDKIESNLIRISLTKSTAVLITDETAMPNKYKKKEIKTSILKKEIGNDLKAGLKIKGAELQDNKNIKIS